MAPCARRAGGDAAPGDDHLQATPDGHAPGDDRVREYDERGGAGICGTLRFEPAAGGTLMSWDWDVAPQGALRLLTLVVGWVGQRQEAAILAGLSQHLESATREGGHPPDGARKGGGASGHGCARLQAGRDLPACVALPRGEDPVPNREPDHPVEDQEADRHAQGRHDQRDRCEAPEVAAVHGCGPSGCADAGRRSSRRPLCSGLPDWAGAPRACGLDDLSALSRAQVSPGGAVEAWQVVGERRSQPATRFGVVWAGGAAPGRTVTSTATTTSAPDR